MHLFKAEIHFTDHLRGKWKPRWGATCPDRIENAAYLALVCIIFLAVDDREIATLFDYRSDGALMRLDRWGGFQVYCLSHVEMMPLLLSILASHARMNKESDQYRYLFWIFLLLYFHAEAGMMIWCFGVYKNQRGQTTLTHWVYYGNALKIQLLWDTKRCLVEMFEIQAEGKHYSELYLLISFCLRFIG